MKNEKKVEQKKLNSKIKQIKHQKRRRRKRDKREKKKKLFYYFHFIFLFFLLHSWSKREGKSHSILPFSLFPSLFDQRLN